MCSRGLCRWRAAWSRSSIGLRSSQAERGRIAVRGASGGHRPGWSLNLLDVATEVGVGEELVCQVRPPRHEEGCPQGLLKLALPDAPDRLGQIARLHQVVFLGAEVEIPQYADLDLVP